MSCTCTYNSQCLQSKPPNFYRKAIVCNVVCNVYILYNKQVLAFYLFLFLLFFFFFMPPFSFVFLFFLRSCTAGTDVAAVAVFTKVSTAVSSFFSFRSILFVVSICSHPLPFDIDEPIVFATRLLCFRDAMVRHCV